jgi:dTDP-4-dehydrorhamnose reductase
MKKKKREIEYFIIGGKGLIGRSIANYLKKKKKNFRVITKQNYNNYKNKNCSIIINANGNSSRYYANTYPKKDFHKSVITVFKSIFDFKYKKYVYISSGDVYEKINKKSNEKKIIETPCNYYGKNKFLAEQIIKFYCNSWIILRSGPVIGSKLKKNIFFDLKKNKKVYSNINSSYSYITNISFSKIIFKICQKANNQIFNISGNKTVSNIYLKRLIKSKSIFDNNKIKEKYSLNNLKIENFLKIKMPNSINEIKKIINNN